MNRKKLQEAFENASQVIERLKEMLDEPVDPKRSQIDSSIKRFELSMELMLRLMQRILESKLDYENSTRGILRKAYKIGLLDDDEAWIEMWTDRNLSVHTYKQSSADKIYNTIKNKYFKLLKSTLDKLAREV